MSMLYQTVQQIYNQALRPYLPYRWGTKAGVEVRDYRLLDLSPQQPGYKQGMVEAIKEHVSNGSVVDEVGAGRGILTVQALYAGAEQIRAYEAAIEMISVARETLNRNCGDDWRNNVELRHAVVGDPGQIYGELDDAETVSPRDLSDADVLILDCEGAELSILANLGSHPEVVICESHPYDGAPAEDIEQILIEDGYSVQRREFEPDRGDKSVVVGHL